MLAALRSIPSVVLMLSMRSVPGNRTYASSIQWGLLLCAAGDALIEMDPLFKSLPIGGRRVRPLSCGLALFMLARAAYAHAFVSDMPSPLRAIGACVDDRMLGVRSVIQLLHVPHRVQIVPIQPQAPTSCGWGPAWVSSSTASWS